MISDKAVRQAIYQRLNTASVTSLLANGSASLRHAVASSDEAFPFVIFNKQSGVPVRRFGGNAFDNQIWLVKAVARDSTSSTAEDIAKAVDDLLDFGTLTISGATTLFVARESDVDFAETQGDQTYRHHGANYRIAVAV